MYPDPHNTVFLRQARHQRLMAGPKLEQEKGRVCQADGCETQLSRYNPSDSCRVHDGWRDARMRRQG